MSERARKFAIALNHVMTACQEAATQNQMGGNICSDEALAGALESLSRERLTHFSDVALKVQADFETATSPSHEKELLDSIKTRPKATIGKDEVGHLLVDCESKEARVSEAAAAALRHVNDPSMRFQLDKLREDFSRRTAVL